MSTNQAHEAKIARWKALPLPYCIVDLRWFGRDLRLAPVSKLRFATTDEALAAAKKRDARDPKRFTTVDFAGFHDAA